MTNSTAPAWNLAQISTPKLTVAARLNRVSVESLAFTLVTLGQNHGNHPEIMAEARAVVLSTRCKACNGFTLSIIPTDADATAVGLCVPCYVEAGMENAHQDGLHDETPDASCTTCRQDLETQEAIEFLTNPADEPLEQRTSGTGWNDNPWGRLNWLPPEVRTLFEDDGIAQVRVTSKDGTYIEWRRAQ